MHHWHSGLPPLPYLWVLRWQVAQGPTLSPEQTSADGSGSEIGGGGVVIVCFLFRVTSARHLLAGYDSDSTDVRAELWNSRPRPRGRP
jgi:hypothetical protein